MGILDRLFGRKPAANQPQYQQAHGNQYGQPPGNARTMTEDERAVERYRYMLKTAPPETIEQAHEEAFSRLTPEQRRLALQELSEATPANERGAINMQQDDPRSLARLATRTEMRQPGTMERVFNQPSYGGGYGGGMMGGGMGLGGTIFTSLAAGFVGSMVAQSFMDSFGDPLAGADSGGDAGFEDQVSDTGDTGADAGGDFGGGDFGGFDDGGGFDMDI